LPSSTLVSSSWRGSWVSDSFFRFFYLNFIFFQSHPSTFDLLEIVLCAFSPFLSTRLSQSYAHGHEINGLTWINLDIFFQLYFSKLDYLIIEIHYFIQFVFNGVALVSWLGHIFGTLTRLSSNPFFLSIYFIVVVFIYFMLSKLYDFFKSMTWVLIFFSNKYIVLAFFLYKKNLGWAECSTGHLVIIFILSTWDSLSLWISNDNNGF
jgi:hypothetical protein